MDVCVGGIGHVIVDHVRNAFHIQAARGDVSGNHDLMRAVLEAFERRLALSLRTVAMQTCDLVPGTLDLLRHFLRAIFRACEDQHRTGIGFFEQRQQQLRLQMRRHRIQRVRDSFRGAADAHRNLLRIL